MKYKTISTERIDDIFILKLDNHKKLNSMSQLFFDEFIEVIEDVFNDRSLRVLIIRADEDIFSAGGDLKDMLTADSQTAANMCMRAQKAFELLQNLDIPVISALSGIVIGGGFELSLHCDIRFASENTSLRLPEVNMGILPAAGGTSLLTKYLSHGDSAYYLFSGKEIPLDIAVRNGIIQKIFSVEEIYSETIKFAQDLSNKSKESLSAIKKVLVSSIYNKLEDCKEMEVKEFSSVLQTSGKEKIKEFFNKK